MDIIEQAVASELGALPETADIEIPEENGAGAIDYETKARENGWKPKELFEGDIEAFVDAEEFVKRAPLIKKMSNQRKKIKELETTVAGMAKHYHGNIEAAKRKVIADLTADRTQAIEIGDVNKVNEIEQEIHNITQVQAPVIPQDTLPVEIEDFLADNSSWWGINAAMTEEAQALNTAFLRQNPGKLKDSLVDTANKLNALYPGKIGKKFLRGARNNIAAVETNGEGRVSSCGLSENNLTKEEKHVYNQYVKVFKIMNSKECLKSLEEARNIGRR